MYNNVNGELGLKRLTLHVKQIISVILLSLIFMNHEAAGFYSYSHPLKALLCLTTDINYIKVLYESLITPQYRYRKRKVPAEYQCLHAQ